MTQASAVWHPLKPYLFAFYTHARLWIVPTLVFTVGGIAYAYLKAPSWRASQAVVVRGEAIGNQNGTAQFGSIDWMKVYQEKILEVARSRVVVDSVLKKLGPPPTVAPGKPWPTEDDIDALQSAISVNAPKGAEFGRTEFFHLSVTGGTPAGALERCRLVCDELERNLGALRTSNAASVIIELDRAQSLARAELDSSTARLETLEREVGEDLGELRLLTETGSGDSNLRATLNQVNQELRQAENSRQSMQQLYELLTESERSPNHLLAMPSRLLESQPGLRSLKEGLSAAKIELSKLKGIMNESHPKVQQAMRAEEQHRQQLQAEVQTALRGIEADLKANAGQAEAMKKQQVEVQRRLDKLAAVRARYHNLVADVRQRSATLDDLQRKLADARAAKNVASTSSQLTRFGAPVVGDRPEGPGKKMFAAGGLVAGFTLGAGMVFLLMPVGQDGRSRRWSDYLNMGRRATDQLFGRRASDTSITTESIGSSRGRNADPAGAGYLSHAVVGGRRNGDLPPAVAVAPKPAPPKPAPPVQALPQSTFPVVDRRQGIGRRSADHGDLLP